MLTLVLATLLIPNGDCESKIREALSNKSVILKIKEVLAKKSCCDNPDCTCKNCEGSGCKCLIAYKVYAMKHPSGRTVYIVSNKKRPLLSDSRNYLNKNIAQLEADRLNGKELKRDAPLRLVRPIMSPSGGC